MPSEFIGVVFDTGNGTIYSVINPDNDAQLDDPSLTANPNTALLLIGRGNFKKDFRNNRMDIGSLSEVLSFAKNIISTRLDIDTSIPNQSDWKQSDLHLSR